MSVVEAQTPLPAPPTGHDLTLAEHFFNPENGYYEPISKTPPLNANIAVTNAAQNLIVGILAGTSAYIYHIMFTNTTGAAIVYTLTEPSGHTYIVTVPANTSIPVTSLPTAPLLKSVGAGNLTVVGSAAISGSITIAYIVK